MKPVKSSIMRSDVIRDNKKTRLPKASHLGFDLWEAKRGNWIRYNNYGNEVFGRVIGGVTCEGFRYIEVMAVYGCFDSPVVRWVDPDDVIQCIGKPPKNVFDFLCGEWNEPADIIALAEYGIKRDD